MHMGAVLGMFKSLGDDGSGHLDHARGGSSGAPRIGGQGGVCRGGWQRAERCIVKRLEDAHKHAQEAVPAGGECAQCVYIYIVGMQVQKVWRTDWGV